MLFGKYVKKVLIIATIFMILTSILGGCSNVANRDNIVPPERNNKENTNTTNSNQIEKEVIRKIGNTSGNLYNDGLVAEDQEWIYYQNQENASKLYRKSKIDSKEELLSDKFVYDINVVDDWCYFIFRYGNYGATIYRIKKDGSKEEKIKESELLNVISDLIVVDDWIYYSVAEFNEKEGYYTGYSLYKIKIDGTLNQKIVDKNIIHFTLDSNYLYYLTYDNNYKKTIYKTSLSGGEEIVISANLDNNFIIDNDKIYFLNQIGGYLFNMNTDGSNIVKLAENVDNFNVYDGTVYFTKKKEVPINSDKEGNAEKSDYISSLFKMSLDGSKVQEIKIDSKELLENYHINILLTNDYIHFLDGAPKKEGVSKTRMYTIEKDEIANGKLSQE
ncbi:hypothetical protein SH2C18_36350 [Clostridium sediminicola]|uniref:DUF5050 domain-containing protein n=1 Tax=Clostridium sediminicola TaxID=3114879 RepID=UPI0031F1F3E6